MNTLTKYNYPLPEEFLSPFSNIVDEFFNKNFSTLPRNFFATGSYPKVNVRDEVDSVVIEAEIPGLTKEQVKVEVSDNILRISGEKQENASGKNYVHRELKRSSFCRSFSIDDATLDSNKMKAKFENGVLEVTLPKKKIDENSSKMRQIPII